MWPVAACLARASATIRGARSTPVTRCPSAASSRESVPVPQPTSSTDLDPAGIQPPSSRAQAARVSASRRPWSGSASKVGAASFQYSVMVGVGVCSLM